MKINNLICTDGADVFVLKTICQVTPVLDPRGVSLAGSTVQCNKNFS